MTVVRGMVVVGTGQRHGSRSQRRRGRAGTLVGGDESGVGGGRCAAAGSGVRAAAAATGDGV